MESMFSLDWDTFCHHWKNYVFQSFLATLAMIIVLFLLTLQNAVIVASIGATSFIIFAMPNNVTARIRNVAGGHMIGMICGMVCSYFIPKISIHPIFLSSLAVGISIFLMVVLDMEHPPATGTALGIASTGFSWKPLLGVITSVVVLSIVRILFRKKIRDLV